jgi:BioD-like phosphotransacetylase family protein
MPHACPGPRLCYNALKYVQDKSLLIVPGDRDDVIFAIVTTDVLRHDIQLAGIVLTGGLQPQSSTMDLVLRTDIPVLTTGERTYDVASRIHDMTVKTRVCDEEKTCLATNLIREHVDLEALWASLM